MIPKYIIKELEQEIFPILLTVQGHTFLWSTEVTLPEKPYSRLQVCIPLTQVIKNYLERRDLTLVCLWLDGKKHIATDWLVIGSGQPDIGPELLILRFDKPFPFYE